MMPAPARRMASERFQGHGPLVDPAALGGGLDHAVLARDVVRRQRHAGKAIAHRAHDVEIGQRRLDHDHVGPFGQVERHLAQRLAGVGGRVHLVAAAIAELRRAFGGVAERAVERAGELGRVAHDRHVREPAPSSRRRIAPTMPSIMPLGATMSAPAWAWLTACRPSSQRGVVIDVDPAGALVDARRNGRGRCTRRSRRR